MSTKPGTDSARLDRILVVDDEEDIRDSVIAILQDALHDVEMIPAANGEEALDVLRAQEVDLILTDYRMPGMDGLELLAEAYRIAPDTARIMMTAFGDIHIATEAINAAHVHNFFNKPFEVDEMVSAVWKVLDDHWEMIQEKMQNASTHDYGDKDDPDTASPSTHRSAKNGDDRPGK